MDTDRLYRLTKEDAPKIIRILTECFREDPLYQKLIPRAEGRGDTHGDTSSQIGPLGKAEGPRRIGAGKAVEILCILFRKDVVYYPQLMMAFCASALRIKQDLDRAAALPEEQVPFFGEAGPKRETTASGWAALCLRVPRLP